MKKNFLCTKGSGNTQAKTKHQVTKGKTPDNPKTKGARKKVGEKKDKKKKDDKKSVVFNITLNKSIILYFSLPFLSSNEFFIIVFLAYFVMHDLIDQKGCNLFLCLQCLLNLLFLDPNIFLVFERLLEMLYFLCVLYH